MTWNSLAELDDNEKAGVDPDHLELWLAPLVRQELVDPVVHLALQHTEGFLQSTLE